MKDTISTTFSQKIIGGRLLLIITKRIKIIINNNLSYIICYDNIVNKAFLLINVIRAPS